MNKFILSVTALILALSLAACSGASDNGSNGNDKDLSDPFERVEGNAEVTVDPMKLPAGVLDLLSSGGYSCSVKADTFLYDGSPMIFPVIMQASDSCKTDISVGICFYINGVPQKLSCGEDTDKTMIIAEGIAPGKAVRLDVTLDPVISKEDADKETLPITYASYYCPAYVPKESYPSFGLLRQGSAITRELTMNAKPENITNIQIEDEYKEFLCTNEHTQSYYPSNSPYDRGSTFPFQIDEPCSGWMKLDENGKLKFSYIIDDPESGDYTLSVMKNNETVKFNNGKDYVQLLDTKEEHIYIVDFELEDVKRGDVVQVVMLNMMKKNNSGVAPPYLVVNSDFS